MSKKTHWYIVKQLGILNTLKETELSSVYSLTMLRNLGKVNGRRFKRVGIIASQMEKIIFPLQYDDTMDSS